MYSFMTIQSEKLGYNGDEYTQVQSSRMTNFVYVVCHFKKFQMLSLHQKLSSIDIFILLNAVLPIGNQVIV